MRFELNETHTDLQEWLYLEQDGGLDPAQRRKLELHLASCRECRQEKRMIGRLEGLLSEAVVPVDRSFSRELMERLPEAAWEVRSVPGWRLAVAVFLIVGAGAAALVLGGGSLAAEAPLAGAAMALFGLFQSALIAGGGLLAASWTGLGLALDRLFDGSRLAFALFGVLVLGFDILFIRMIVRYRTRSAAAEDGRDTGSGR